MAGGGPGQTSRIGHGACSITPSVTIHARLIPANHLAHRAARCHPASGTLGAANTVGARPEQLAATIEAGAWFGCSAVTTTPPLSRYLGRRSGIAPPPDQWPPTAPPQRRAGREVPAGSDETARRVRQAPNPPGRNHVSKQGVWRRSSFSSPFSDGIAECLSGLGAVKIDGHFSRQPARSAVEIWWTNDAKIHGRRHRGQECGTEPYAARGAVEDFRLLPGAVDARPRGARRCRHPTVVRSDRA
jgi:hypothetical protein